MLKETTEATPESSTADQAMEHTRLIALQAENQKLRDALVTYEKQVAQLTALLALHKPENDVKPDSVGHVHLNFESLGKFNCKGATTAWLSVAKSIARDCLTPADDAKFLSKLSKPKYMDTQDVSLLAAITERHYLESGCIAWTRVFDDFARLCPTTTTASDVFYETPIPLDNDVEKREAWARRMLVALIRGERMSSIIQVLKHQLPTRTHPEFKVFLPTVTSEPTLDDCLKILDVFALLKRRSRSTWNRTSYNRRGNSSSAATGNDNRGYRGRNNSWRGN